MSLWKAIAKNEIRLRTSLFRNHRVLFFIILYLLLLVWAFYLCPLLFDLFMPTLVEQVPQILIAVALTMEYIMMAFFLAILIYPLNTVFRRTEIGFKEILLASPASPGDIFLGEFIGKFPIYSAGLLLLAPILIGMINPIINLNLIQYIVIYVCIFGMILFAALLGSILSSWLEHKIAQSERSRDLGKVLLFLLSIAMVAIIYSLQFLFNFLANNPEIKNWVMFYPSLWFSNIILYFMEPSLISSYILNIWTSSALAIVVPILVLFIAYKNANKFFTVEGALEKMSSIIEKENKFYLLIRKVTGHKWEGLIITQLKEFLRRRETIMKIVYLCGLVSVLGVIFSFTMKGLEDLVGQAIIIVLLIYMGGMMYGLLFGSYIFVGTKDLIWVYKRSPRNIHSLVYSYLITMFIFNFLMALGITIFFSIYFEFDFFNIIFFFSFYLINSEIVIFQAVGIQCLNPSFEEKGRAMTTNILSLMVLQVVPFQLILILILVSFPKPSSPIVAKFILLTPILLVALASSIPLLFFGLRKLNKLE
jgi:hypothetical protein